MGPIGSVGRRTFLAAAIPAAVMVSRPKPAKARYDEDEEAGPVLYVLPKNEVHTPNNAASLLQGFLGTMQFLSKKDGELTKPDFKQYHDILSRIRLSGPLPFMKVAAHLEKNFDALAKRDGKPESISCNDLVTLRKD